MPKFRKKTGDRQRISLRFPTQKAVRYAALAALPITFAVGAFSRAALSLARREFRVTAHVTVAVLMLGMVAAVPAAPRGKALPEKPLLPSGSVERPAKTEVTAFVASLTAQPVTALINEAKTEAVSLRSEDGAVQKPLPVMTSAKNDLAKIELESYQVQPGDTLSGIANRFDLRSSTLLWTNALNNADSLKIGQTLMIPSADGVLHTVQPGETTRAIAAKYKASETTLVMHNDLEARELAPGMRLFVPGGEKELPRPAPVPSVKTAPRPAPAYASAAPIGSRGRFVFPTRVGPMGYYNGYHWWALDIPTGCGTPIWASDAGRVVESRYGWNGGYGGTILIDHGNGFMTRYAHLQSLAVSGGWVAQGQYLGAMGTTGRSTGCHLHFEILKFGARQNPLWYL